jgi:hypothetical protein
MGGFDRDKAKRVFKVPDEYGIGIMIEIGYQDSHDILPERYKEKANSPRERKQLLEIAFLKELGNGII